MATFTGIRTEYIHYHSNRSYNAMQKVNCASFPESLLDNELFGHDKGAYTGADSTYKGIFERANESTLFLDELGDMSKSIQTKILRAIQNMEIRRIGGKDLIKVNVRFVAATNKPLRTLVEHDAFREDLFFRLNAGVLDLPPLRDRKEDVPYLIESFVEQYNEEYANNSTMTEGALQYLMSYSWPGNVRELKNVISYACAMAMDSKIEIRHFPPSILNIEEVRKDNGLIIANERALIISTLHRTDYNKRKASEMLGISRQALYNKIKRYNISTKTVIQE